MGIQSNASRVLVLLIAVTVPLAEIACSDDASDEDAGSAGGSAGNARGGASASRGGSSASGGEPGSGTEGGASGNEGSGGAGTGDGGGETNGSAGAPTGGGSGLTPPPPTEEGTSVYAEECTDEDTAPCGPPAATCVGITTMVDEEARIGFTCSNHCDTAADCSMAPTGAEAEPDCVQFQTEKRCVLMCNVNGTDYECPSGMSCYTHMGAPFGYCLWYPD